MRMPGLTIVVAALALGGGMSATPALAANPSFDCAKASTAVEKLLCADDELARQDRLLSVVYGRAMDILPSEDQAALRTSQRAWARGRANACPPAADQAAACLTGLYKTRIAEIRPLSFSNLRFDGGPDVQADRRAPLVCLRFDTPLRAKQPAALESYVASAGGEALAVRARGNQLCIEGLAHGARHQLTVREGLEGEGALLRGDVSLDIDIPDRPRRVAFPSRGLILPRVDGGGLPIETVNVARVRALILRVDDDDVIDGLRRGLIDQQVNYSDVGRIASKIGRNVWTGEIEVKGARNEAVRTAIPIDAVTPGMKPGVYLAVAEDPEAGGEQEWWAAAQWFVVSDVGLTTFSGDDGLTVAARSLATAMPLAGARIALVAEDGETLGEAKTDAQGIARLAPGLLRGSGGKTARAVYAYGGGGDFVYLDLARAPIDLSDRGVSGREAPGALDAFVSTERGVYRPGGRVYLTALLRDAAAKATPGLPLTLKIFRSDGVQALERTLQDKGAAGYSTFADIAPTAPTGMWRATVHADPAGAAVGQTQFLVEDFVPPRIEAVLDATIDGATLQADISANYLYGAPAAGLPGEINVRVRPSRAPVADHPGYRFGRVDEEPLRPYLAGRQNFETDADGVARLDIGVGDWPSTSFPLEAVARVNLFDVGGRPLNKQATVQLANQPVLVGVKPLFDGESVALGGNAAFEVLVFDPAGQAIDRQLDYRLIREEIEYIWFRQNGRWDYETQHLEREIIDAGDVLAGADTPARIERRFEGWGGYRLDVTDPATGAATSVRFHAGGWGALAAAEEPEPDKVKVTLPQGPHRPGDEIRVLIEPPFDAEIMATVVDGAIHETKLQSVPASGGEIVVTLPADGAGGAYVLVNAFAKAEGTRSLAPRRAIGAAYAAYDPAPKALGVIVTAPSETEPGRTVDVRVAVSPAVQQAYVTLAAVDDGVLGLTNYASPDPGRHYLGKRRLAVELRDIYGRFIDAAGAEIGRVRSGGGAKMAEMARAGRQDLPQKSVQVVALFSGVVPIGPDGVAVVPLALPEFSGRLRLMAQAWSEDRVGAAEAELLVRRPVVASLALPRFLAPGDRATAQISLRNIAGPEGEYAARLTVSGAVQAPTDISLVAGLATTDLAAVQPVTLTAGGPGEARFRLDVTGPGGIAFSVERRLSVRPAAPAETVSVQMSVAPGDALMAPANILAGVHQSSARVTFGLNPLPNLGLPRILSGLVLYPYGCAEQTTSTATPWLFADALAKDMGLLTDGAGGASVTRGIARLIGMQTYSGGFGFWNSNYEAAPWVSAYVADFLVEASNAGFDVPAGPMARALDRLSEIVDQGAMDRQDGPAAAYALYVRAKANVADPARARRFGAQALQNRSPGLTLAFAGAALAAVGDRPTAERLFKAAVEADDINPGLRYRHYGSDVRDAAAILALAAEHAAFPWPELEARAEALAASVADTRWLSTQEQAWILRAAARLGAAAKTDGFAVELDGVRLSGPGAGIYRSAAMASSQMPALRNIGARPVTGVVTVTGAPIAPGPATEAGFKLTRRYFSAEGRPLDPAQLRQNQLVVVVLDGKQMAKSKSRALLVDYLPAGLELENAKLGGGDLGAYGWLGRVTSPEHQELRDDRYVMAFDSNGGRKFRAAYLARAVTPGSFVHAGARVEAMYRPDRFGRTAPGAIAIAPF